MTDAKYQRAIAGLIHAMKGPWDLDMRDNDFTEADTVYRAVCANATKLRSLNLLTLKNDESTNLRDSLQRNMYLLIRA